MASKVEPCYDCGSTIQGHHTKLCEMGPDNAVRDLPAVPTTQWWVGGKQAAAYLYNASMALAELAQKMPVDFWEEVSIIDGNPEHKCFTKEFDNTTKLVLEIDPNFGATLKVHVKEVK